MTEPSMAEVVLEAHDPYGTGRVVLGYDEHGRLYLEVRHESDDGEVHGFARATFSNNPKYLRRFLRDAHKAEPE